MFIFSGPILHSKLLLGHVQPLPGDDDSLDLSSALINLREDKSLVETKDGVTKAQT